MTTYLSDFYINDSQEIPPHDDALSFTGVMDAFDKAPQSHAEARSSRPGVPLWAVALIIAGLALMAVGWLMNEPVSILIYTMIHGS